MKLHYTTRQIEIPESLRKKLEGKFQKIRKILGNRHEPEAHLILSLERHLYHAEVTVHYRHHTMVVESAGADLPGVLLESAEKLEKQVLRNKDRWRELKRRGKAVPEWEAAEAALPARDASASLTPRLYRSKPAAKPLTLEEAMLEIQQDGRDCVVYRDADKGRLAVLYRRRDGHLELVEG
jgi:putative sigma-54 modulation protein